MLQKKKQETVPEPDVMSVWKGRTDLAEGPLAARWHEKVERLTPSSSPGVALIGFACDEGVRRNGGRVGAADGPRALRAALANLAWHQGHPVYDAGDVGCTDGKLEAAQARLGRAVHDAIAARQRPLVLGGGHELAWGSHGGLVRAVHGIDPNLRIGIVNLDAHFDLRAETQANSGTSFAQIARWCAENDRVFRYMCLGVAEPSNTAALFDRATRFRVQWRTDTALEPWHLDDAFKALSHFVELVDVLHLSVDLDVLPAAVMPAVSAPAGRGVPMASVEAIIAALLGTGKVGLVDLAEFNPAHDPDGCGARTAARLAWSIAKDWSVPGDADDRGDLPTAEEHEDDYED